MTSGIRIEDGDSVDIVKCGENVGRFTAVQRGEDKCKYDGWVNMNASHKAIGEMIARLKTINEWRVFFCVSAALDVRSQRAEITQSDIAYRLDMDAGDVSRALKRLLTAPAGMEPMLRRHDSHFVVNPEYVSVGNTDNARAAWRRAKIRQDELAARKAAGMIKKIKSGCVNVNTLAFADETA